MEATVTKHEKHTARGLRQLSPALGTEARAMDASGLRNCR
jgi:hypothetical protein